MRKKVGKSRNTVFFQWFVAPEGRKVGSLKRRVRSQLARWVMKNCTPLWREAHFEVKMYTIVGPLLEVTMSKKCTPLWREAHFPVKMHKTPFSDHFWKLRRRKSARRCGAKHISKSKCTKHTILGPLLEVETSKKCTPLWREAHFEVKMYKTPQCRTTFGGSDVEKVHAAVARSTFRSQNVQNTRGSDHFWRFRCRFASLHYTTLCYTTLHYTTLHYSTLHYTTLQLQLHNYTPLHSTTLHYTPLHSTTLQLQLQLHNYTPLQYTPLHSTTLNYTTLHYITLHYTPLHYTTLHYTTFHYTSLHYTTLHYTTTTTTTTQLHSTTLHYTKLHYTTLHYTTLHYTTLHYIPLHSTTLHYITLHYIIYTEWHCTTDRQVDR